MGFRTGAYAKVWAVEPKSDVNTKIRISISVKDKQTEEYRQEFSGFVFCLGSVAAKKAANLKEGDRIKLGDVDVSTNYVKETKTTYYNFRCFSFEMADAPTHGSADVTHDATQPEVDSGEIPDDRLPF